MLSSGVDGTIKLWNHNWSEEPLINFEASEDFLGCVQWCPWNSCVFAGGDGKGNL